MALLNANNRILARAKRISRRAPIVEVWQRMPSIARTVTSRDMLELRAMWRRCGRPLEVRATVVGGVIKRFLAP